VLIQYKICVQLIVHVYRSSAKLYVTSESQAGELLEWKHETGLASVLIPGRRHFRHGREEGAFIRRNIDCQPNGASRVLMSGSMKSGASGKGADPEH